MRVGVVFPQTEIGTDPALIKDYAQTAEELGFLHILAYDHVIGANPASRRGWTPVGRANRSYAQTLDAGTRHFRRALAQDHRRRDQSAAGSAADPDLVRRQRRPRFAPSRQAWRRLVSADGAR